LERPELRDVPLVLVTFPPPDVTMAGTGEVGMTPSARLQKPLRDDEMSDALLPHLAPPEQGAEAAREPAPVPGTHHAGHGDAQWPAHTPRTQPIGQPAPAMPAEVAPDMQPATPRPGPAALPLPQTPEGPPECPLPVEAPSFPGESSGTGREDAGARLGEARERIQTLEECLQAIGSERDRLLQEIGERDMAIAELRKQNADLDEKARSMEAAAANMAELVRRMRAASPPAQAQQPALVAEASDHAQGRIQNMAREIARLREELDETRRRCEAAEAEVSRLRGRALEAASLFSRIADLFKHKKNG
jgi:hypothetical protein